MEVTKIIEWGKERDLIKSENAKTQVLKLYEEFGELCKALLENDKPNIRDSIGDMKVVAILLKEIMKNIKGQTNINSPVFRIMKILYQIAENVQYINFANEKIDFSLYFKLDLELDMLAKLEGYTLQDALNSAYEEIKDRKGKTVNGTFIKEK